MNDPEAIAANPKSHPPNKSEPSSQGPPRHLVITVHGIRTYGQWQDRLEALLKKALGSNIDARNYRYGYFSLIAFMIPFLRWIVTRRFRGSMLTTCAEQDWERIDLVGHSFGTHLIAWALHSVDPGQRPKIHTVLLAGSVLKPTFPWSDLMPSIERVVNDCGTQDSVLVLNQLAVLFTGMAGRIGFTTMEGDRFRNRYFDVSHSGYFLREDETPQDEFMREYWMPLLTTDEAPLPLDKRMPLTLFRGISEFILRNIEPVKLTAYATTLVLCLVWLYDQRLTWLESRSRELAAQANEQLSHRLDRALLLGCEANTLAPTVEARTAILKALQQVPYHMQFLTTDNNSVEHIEFSPRGDLVATATLFGRVSIWSTTSGERIASPLNALNTRIERIQFLQDGHLFIMVPVSGKGMVVWGIREGTNLHEFAKGWSGPAICRNVIAVGNVDGSIALQEAGTAKVPIELRGGHSNAVTAIAFSPEGDLLASGDLNGHLAFWNTQEQRNTMKVLQPFLPIHDQYPRAITALAFDRSGRKLVCGNLHGEIAVLETPSGTPVLHLTNSNGRGVEKLEFSDNGSTFTVRCNTGDVYVRSTDTGDVLAEPLTSLLKALGRSDANHLIWYSGIAPVDEDYQLLASWHMSTITLMATNGERRIVLPGSRGGRVAFGPKGKLLCAGKNHETILMDVGRPQPDGIQIKAVQLPDVASSVAFDTGGGTLIFGFRNGSVSEFSLGNPQAVTSGRTFKAMETALTTIAISRDGSSIAATGENNIVCTWDRRTHQPLIVPKSLNTRNHFRIVGIAFSPSGSDLILRYQDGSGLLVSTNGNNTRPLSLDSRRLLLAQPWISSDGRLAAGTDFENEGVTLWDARGKRPIGRLHADQLLPPSCCAFSPDGRNLVVSWLDSSATVYDVDVNSWMRRARAIANRALTEDEVAFYISKKPRLR